MTVLKDYLRNTTNVVKWFPIEHGSFHEQFEIWRKENLELNHPENGVYILCSENPVNRVLDNDQEGILYIGKGIILPYHNRIGKFINSCNGTEDAHDGGIRYRKVEMKYPKDLTQVCIILNNDAEKLEAELQQKYYDEFGEVPPLNMKLENE